LEIVMAVSLFAPYRLGGLELPNRILMAPMTRNRAGAGGVPVALNAQYYAQRAGAGLIITEGTQPSATGRGYPGTPGLHDAAQQRGWAHVVDAVHLAGGRIFIQLMHAGRVSHSALQPAGRLPVAPSAVRPAGEVFTGAGWEPFEMPRALERRELPAIRQEFVAAARRAMAAGAEGVELHAANGYLLHQFLAAGGNHRNDAYGGSIENRIRLTVEVATAVAEAVGGHAVGLRISPGNTFNDVSEPDAPDVYQALLGALQPLGLAYLHVIESPLDAGFSALELARRHWDGPIVANSGGWELWDADDAQAIVAAGQADLVSFGRQFLANPDLARRLRLGAHLNEPDQATFYGGNERGYTDYPRLEEELQHAA
jgi:N-ethylmaleimide reductase